MFPGSMEEFVGLSLHVTVVQVVDDNRYRSNFEGLTDDHSTLFNYMEEEYGGKSFRLSEIPRTLVEDFAKQSMLMDSHDRELRASVSSLLRSNQLWLLRPPFRAYYRVLTVPHSLGETQKQAALKEAIVDAFTAFGQPPMTVSSVEEEDALLQRKYGGTGKLVVVLRSGTKHCSFKCLAFWVHFKTRMPDAILWHSAAGGKPTIRYQGNAASVLASPTWSGELSISTPLLDLLASLQILWQQLPGIVKDDDDFAVLAQICGDSYNSEYLVLCALYYSTSELRVGEKVTSVLAAFAASQIAEEDVPPYDAVFRKVWLIAPGVGRAWHDVFDGRPLVLLSCQREITTTYYIKPLKYISEESLEKWFHDFTWGNGRRSTVRSLPDVSIHSSSGFFHYFTSIFLSSSSTLVFVALIAVLFWCCQ